MKENNYILYSLRVLIIALIAWLSMAIFSPAVNAKEQLFQKETIQSQKEVNSSLQKTAEIEVRFLEKLLVYRPYDRNLLEDYQLIEKECHLTLDTLKELFSNTSISNSQLTEEKTKLIEHLKQKILVVLNKVASTNPIITNEEIQHLDGQFSAFQYDLKNTNRELIEVLTINQIKQIKLANLYFLSGKIGGRWHYHHSPYIDPMIILPTFRKNKLGQIKVVLSTSSRSYLREDSLKINQAAFLLKDGVAHYSTIYNDSLLKKITIEGHFKHAEDSSDIIIQDTFDIYPTQKQ